MAGFMPADRTHVPERHSKNKTTILSWSWRRKLGSNTQRCWVGGSGHHGPGRCGRGLHQKVEGWSGAMLGSSWAAAGDGWEAAPGWQQQPWVMGRMLGAHGVCWQEFQRQTTVLE